MSLVKVGVRFAYRRGVSAVPAAVGVALAPAGIFQLRLTASPLKRPFASAVNATSEQ